MSFLRGKSDVKNHLARTVPPYVNTATEGAPVAAPEAAAVQPMDEAIVDSIPAEVSEVIRPM